jgi:hypothetical protein
VVASAFAFVDVEDGSCHQIDPAAEVVAAVDVEAAQSVHKEEEEVEVEEKSTTVRNFETCRTKSAPGTCCQNRVPGQVGLVVPEAAGFHNPP